MPLPMPVLPVLRCAGPARHRICAPVCMRRARCLPHASLPGHLPRPRLHAPLGRSGRRGASAALPYPAAGALALGVCLVCLCTVGSAWVRVLGIEAPRVGAAAGSVGLRVWVCSALGWIASLAPGKQAGRAEQAGCSRRGRTLLWWRLRAQQPVTASPASPGRNRRPPTPRTTPPLPPAARSATRACTTACVRWASRL